MISHQIVKLRNEKKWSQTQLARAMNVHLTTVRKWEAGTSDPSAGSTLRLCELFNVTADYLLFGKDDTTSIYIGALSKAEQKKIIAIVQLYINLST